MSMQTPKTRVGTLEVPQRTSPATPRTARQLKTTGSDSDSPHPSSRTPKERSPKIAERRSPRSPVPEKRRPNRVSELESQLSQLQDDLKKAKDQLNSSESWKRRAQHEAEEAKKQVLAMSAKLEESQQQLIELSASEEARLQELQKISQDRDREWQSELEAVQKQHSMDSTALASAMNEIQKLKIQLEMVTDSESADDEIRNLRRELTETLSTVNEMKTQITDFKESEARALEAVSKTEMQLDVVKITAEKFRSDGLKALEAYNSVALDFEESKARVDSLEELVKKLQEDIVRKSLAETLANADFEESNKLREELNFAKFEVSQLRSALDATEMRYQEEYVQSTLQVRSAYEKVELMKLESSTREAELGEELMKMRAEIEELKAKLVGKQTEIENITLENEKLISKSETNQGSEIEYEIETLELKKLESDLVNLKGNLLEKERELQSILVENEILKLESGKSETERTKTTDDAVVAAESARASEREALTRLGYVTEEADKSSRRAARVVEQLDAAQAANSELEAEMRRLKVQSEQWRKAAEAAAAMLSTGNNGKFVGRTGSLDSSYNTIGGNMGSPYSEDMEADSPKKKNGNVLRKIGVLWRKGQK